MDDWAYHPRDGATDASDAAIELDTPGDTLDALGELADLAESSAQDAGDAPGDVAPFDAVDVSDEAADVREEEADAPADTTTDTVADAGVRDAEEDVVVDSAVDAGMRDAAVDAVVDSAVDAGVRDAAVDVVTDAGVDVGTCPSGQTRCGAACVDLATARSDCGACGNICPARANGTAVCRANACGVACNTGFGDCDGAVVNGCEVNLLTATASCGACGSSCPAVANATATCAAGTCGFECNSGWVRSGSSCLPITAPRPIAPLSTSTINGVRATLRWRLASGTDGAHVEVCRDRACGTIEWQSDVAGSSCVTPTLTRGTHFWRLRGMIGTNTGRTAGPTWQFVKGLVTATASDASWGSAADFNGDGYTDLAVGAPGAQYGAGRVYVFDGSSTGLPAVWTTRFADRDGAGGEFGASVASAGDVNGDGFADLIVGARGANASAGRAYIFHGGADGLTPTLPATTLVGAGAGGQFGAVVAGAGDVNGDGYADVIVGAPRLNTETGSMYLFLGSATGLPTTAAVSQGGYDGARGYFGAALASAGDVNGDGYSDIVVGAYGAATTTGRAYVFHGRATAPVVALVETLTGPDGMDGGFGASVAGAGDINGDGYSDVIVGAPWVRTQSGTVYAYHGGAGGLGVTHRSAIGGYWGNGQFGITLAAAGNLNGDGYADAVVGAYRLNTLFAFMGSFDGIPSGVAPSGPGPRSLVGPATNGNISSVSAGDFNGDGLTDLAVGSDILTSAASPGAVWVFITSSSGVLPTTPSTEISGFDGSNDYFGRVIAAQ